MPDKNGQIDNNIAETMVVCADLCDFMIEHETALEACHGLNALLTALVQQARTLTNKLETIMEKQDIALQEGHVLIEMDILMVSDAIASWIFNSAIRNDSMPEALTLGLLYELKDRLDLQLLKRALDIMDEQDKKGIRVFDCLGITKQLKEQ